MEEESLVEALLAAEELLFEGKKKKKRNPNYFKGLSGSTASARSAQFNRQSKMSDDNPDAYRLAPGDSKKTKPSKWNKKFRQMFGEKDIEEFAPSSSGSVDLGVNSEELEEGIVSSLIMIAESLKGKDGLYTDESSFTYAAAKAAMAGEPTFSLDGKKFKTNMSKEKAKQILDGEDDTISEEGEIEEALFQIADQVIEEALSAKTRKALKKKAEKANAPMGALTTVYNKGLAAWRTGHRPGASQHAWAMARVNSFLAGGPARRVDAAQWERVKKHRKKKS